MIAVIFAALTTGGMAATVHVTTNGNDANPGTAEAPVATFAKAIALADQEGGEIIVHAGRYRQVINIPPGERTEGAEAPPLVIRAVDGEKAFIDGGAAVEGAGPMPGRDKVFIFKLPAPRNSAAELWEEDTRIRYARAADAASVARFPGSFASLDDATVVFSTSDGAPPAKHALRVSRWNELLLSWRENVTVRGLAFENCLGWHYSFAVDMRARNSAVEDCTFSNCYRSINAGGGSVRMRVRGCEGRDVGAGVFSTGVGTTVERCRFFAARGPFRFEMYPQDDCGIQFYNPANGGTARFNLCEGFLQGIFLKAVTGALTVEHNTCVAESGAIGFYLSDWNPGSVVRRNILCGFTDAIHCPEFLAAGGIFDENLFWNPLQPQKMWTAMVEPRKYGTGRFNRIGEPGFVAPGRGDFRLLRTAAAMVPGDAEGPVGAYPAVTDGYADASPPSLQAVPDAPAQYNGPAGKRYFTDDPWNGGKTALVEDLRPDDAPLAYLTPKREVRLILRPEHPTEAVEQMKVAVDGQAAPALPFKAIHELVLSDRDGSHRIEIRVATRSGAWSPPVRMEIILARKPPTVVGTPQVRTSKYGAVVRVMADRPALCTVEVPARNDGPWREIANSSRTRRDWDPNLGGTSWEAWTQPEPAHVLALTESVLDWIPPGRECPYRVKLKDAAGNESVTAYTLKMEGEPRILYVAPDGKDAENRGGREAPFATLQFALDRALSGDTVRLLPGVHKGPAALDHGGVRDAPIAIEAAEPGTAVLDGMKRTNHLLYLENAPWVVIRNLEIRWFKRNGINIQRSPYVSVTGCHVWNETFSADWPVGVGVLFHESPNGLLDHTHCYRMETGVLLWYSPKTRITYNTIACNLYNGIDIIYSAEGTVVRNNASCFNGIANLGVWEDPKQDVKQSLAGLDLDYNNYASRIRESELGDLPPAENLVLTQKCYRDSKGIVKCGEQRYYRLATWKTFSGKDAHSICVDPGWADPARRRFDAMKGSPLLGAGENGATIGALGVKPD